MQAIYGVVDSGLFWSHATGKGWNFVWGVGQTPFGPLSNMASLSFVQRDVAVRNMALSYLNSSLTHAQLLIQGYQWMAPYDGGLQHVKNFLRPDQVGDSSSAGFDIASLTGSAAAGRLACLGVCV
jgi:hypothetical protein